MIELATNCASCSPTSGAATHKGEWQLTMSQWRQQALQTALPSGLHPAPVGCFLEQRLAAAQTPVANNCLCHLMFL